MFLSVTAELLKRLDDSSEEVRGVALRALSLWLSGLTQEYNPEWCAAHLQLLFQQLLLHLDDPDSRVQEQVLGEARPVLKFYIVSVTVSLRHWCHLAFQRFKN